MLKKVTEGSPIKQIFLFSIPLFIGNIFQQVYTMSDTAIVGKFIGVDALAAVGSTGSLNFAVFCFFAGLTNGVTILTGQFFGASDDAGVRRSITTGAIIITAALAVASVALFFLMPLLLHLLNVPQDIYDDAYAYAIVLFPCLGCMVYYNLLSGIARALGDSVTPLIFLIISCALNIGLDLLCIVTFQMGVGGAAWATILSQFLSCLACGWYLYTKFPLLRLKRSDWHFSMRIARTEIKVAMPIALQFLITASGTFILGIFANELGKNYIAAAAIGTRVDSILLMPIISLAIALTTFTAQNFGAKLYRRIYIGFRDTTLFLLAFSISGGVLLHFIAKPFALCFMEINVSSQEDILNAVQLYVDWVAYTLWILALLHTLRHIQQGMGYSMIPMYAGIGEMIVRSLIGWLLVHRLGFLAVSFASPAAWFFATIILFIGYWQIRKIFKLPNGTETGISLNP